MEAEYLLDNAAAPTGQRFSGLEMTFDDATFRHLAATGVTRGVVMLGDRRRGRQRGLRIPCALGGTRTPNLLIRRSVRPVQDVLASPPPQVRVRQLSAR